MYILQIAFALHPTTNEFANEPIDFKSRLGFDLPFEISMTFILSAGASFVPAVQYNGANLYLGFTNSKNKAYALLCALPFFQLYVCVFLAAYFSQFWTDYCALFLFGLGNWLTHVTGYLNLMSSAKSDFNPMFADPFIFCGLVYADYYSLLPRDVLAKAYLSLIFVRLMLYVLFMRGMIVQICDYCNIPFLRVK